MNNTQNNFQRNIIKIYFFKFFVSFSLISGIITPFFLEWGQISLAKVLFIQSWFLVWVSVFEIPAGAIADYFGRKNALLFSSSFFIFSYIMLIIYPSFELFLLGEFVMAFAHALLSGTDDALIYESLQEQGKEKSSKKIFGHASSFNMIGILVGAPIGSILAHFFGFRLPVALMIVPYSAALIIALTLNERHIKKSKEEKSYKNYFYTLFRGFSLCIKNRAIMSLAFDMIITTSIGFFIVLLYQPLIQKNGVNVFYFGIILSALIGLQVIIINSYTGLERFLKTKKQLIHLLSFFSGIFFIGAGTIHSALLSSVCVVIGGALILSRKPLFISYINKFSQSETRSISLSTVSMLEKLFIVLSSFVVEVIVGISIQWVFVAFGVIAMLLPFLSFIKDDYLVD